MLLLRLDPLPIHARRRPRGQQRVGQRARFARDAGLAAAGVEHGVALEVKIGHQRITPDIFILKNDWCDALVRSIQYVKK